MNYTAELRNWGKVSLGDAFFIYGDIYGDSAGRFEDGAQITTSYVLKQDGDVAYTRNSVYKLVGEEKK